MHPTSPYGSVVNSRPEPKRPVRIPLFPSQAGIIGLHQPTVSDEMPKADANIIPDGRRIRATRGTRQGSYCSITPQSDRACHDADAAVICLALLAFATNGSERPGAPQRRRRSLFSVPSQCLAALRSRLGHKTRRRGRTLQLSLSDQSDARSFLRRSADRSCRHI